MQELEGIPVTIYPNFLTMTFMNSLILLLIEYIWWQLSCYLTKIYISMNNQYYQTQVYFLITFPVQHMYAFLSVLSYVWLFVISWIIAHQAPLSMEFSRQEYWGELTVPTPEDLPTQGSNPGLLRLLQANSLPLHFLQSPCIPLGCVSIIHKAFNSKGLGVATLNCEVRKSFRLALTVTRDLELWRAYADIAWERT